MNEIKKYSLGNRDTLFNNFVQEIYQKIHSTVDAHDASEKLLLLKKDLQETLKLVSSNEEVKALQEAISTLRKTTSIFTSGKNMKADAIEEALMQTPLEKRSTVISSKGLNAVQEALAMHRHVGKTGAIYKINGQIDENKASKAYKDLKDRFRKKNEQKNTQDDSMGLI